MGACAGAHAPVLFGKPPVGRDDSARQPAGASRRAGVVAPYAGALSRLTGHASKEKKGEIFIV